jgi:CheY-like chemotaxis protein
MGSSPGTIALRTGVFDLESEDLKRFIMGERLTPGRHAYLEVEDEGCGMEESIRSRIFEPFFSTKFTGRGLGLAAVRGIVQGHDGAFEVHSRVHCGTRIRVVFPISGEAASPPVFAVSARERWRGAWSVLLADDEAAPRRITARLLEEIGFECVQAENGKDALSRFREEPRRFVLAVLDVVMPVLDGPGCYRELRRLRPDCPVLFISGYDDQSLKNELQEPATGFLQKPFRIAELRELVGGLVERAQASPGS